MHTRCQVGFSVADVHDSRPLAAAVSAWRMLDVLDDS